MPIAVGCQCGQRFAAPDHLAGKQVKCPKCGSALHIPAPQQQGAAAAPQQAAAPRPATQPSQPMPAGPGPRDLFAEAGFVAPTPGMSTCPACQAPMHQQAVLCVKCGFDRRVGKKVQGVAMSAPAAHGGHGDVSSVLLARAAKTIDEDKAEEAKTRAQGLPAWAYAVMLLVLFALTVNLLRNGVIHSMVSLGVLIIVVSSICKLVFGLQYIIGALKLDTWLTLGCMVIGFIIALGIHFLCVALVLYVIPPEERLLLSLVVNYRKPLLGLCVLIYIPVTLRNWEALHKSYYRYFFALGGTTLGIAIILIAITLKEALATSGQPAE